LSNNIGNKVATTNNDLVFPVMHSNILVHAPALYCEVVMRGEATYFPSGLFWL
jgi:hypothetical protein